MKRLMIFMPPRHGKSELVTTKYAAWRLTQDPKLRIIIGSHKQDLATSFSMGVRNAFDLDRELAESQTEEPPPEKPRRERIPHNAESCDFCTSHPAVETDDCPRMLAYAAAEKVV